MTRLVYLTLGGQSLATGDNALPCRMFSSYEAFLASGEEPSIIILESEDKDKGLPVLRAIRGRKATFLTPVLLAGGTDEEMNILGDGRIATLQEAMEQGSAMQARIAALNQHREAFAASAMLRLLAYLYVRPGSLLLPLRRWNNPGLFSYPLLEALLESGQETQLVLSSLVDRQLIETAGLIDRVRHCPGCDYAHFNFIDICPVCGSFDIQQKPFLHCFACGNVAPQEQFLQGGSLLCPQCHARLRHIGADYDRPLENFSCSGCGAFFQEPDIIAHCQNCGRKNTPDSLGARPVHSYRLTENGQRAVRTGELADVYRLLDDLQNISPAHFTYTLNWLLKLCRRHQDQVFSLVGIRISNITELHEQIGGHRLVELVDSYILRVRDIIRTTDLTTRSFDDVLWILLPHTDCPNCDIVLHRILALQDLSVQEEKVGLRLHSVTYSAPGNMIEEEGGEQLLQRLTGELA